MNWNATNRARHLHAEPLTQMHPQSRGYRLSDRALKAKHIHTSYLGGQTQQRRSRELHLNIT